MKSNFCQALMMLCICSIIVLIDCAPFALPRPVISYDQESIEVGMVQFYRADDNQLATSEYYKAFTFPLLKINRFKNNNFQKYCGYRSLDIIQSTMAQGHTEFKISILSATATDLTIECYVSLETRMNYIKANYILIHEALWSTLLIYGSEWSNPTQPACAHPGTTTCPFPQSSMIDTNKYKYFIFFRTFVFYRSDDLTNKALLVACKITPLTSSFNIDIQLGQTAQLRYVVTSMILVSKSLLEPTAKRRLMIDWIINDPTVTTGTIPLSYPVYDITYFVGINLFRNIGNQYKCNIFIDPANYVITGNVHYSGSILSFQGISLTGYTCANGFYLNEVKQTCFNCMDHCLRCAPDPYKIVKCFECDTNFNLATDNSSCQCPWAVISGMCQDFSSLNLNDCRNSQMNNSIVQCNFCSSILFKVVQNNLCVCKPGYDDLDGDGICLETCGDGLIFQQECDDGNTIPKDGCSSTCTKESGFDCDANQPTFCQSAMPLSYKVSKIEKVKAENRGRITLELMNDVATLPYDFFVSAFQPSQVYVRLYLILSESPLQETEITDLTLLELSSTKEMTLEFSYSFTVENLKARVEINYGQTRYSHYLQLIRPTLTGITDPLIYSNNMAVYNGISIMLCVGTALSLVGLLIGLLSPKYIGLESLITLQLIFFSQLLITDPSKWPVGFLYLKYLKFASGYNGIFSFTSYTPLTDIAKKLHHLAMQKTVCENFNINFVVLFLAFVVFTVIYSLKWIKQNEVKQLQAERKAGEKSIPDETTKLETQEKVKSLVTVTSLAEKAFWVLNHLSLWAFLPLLATVSAHIFINNQTVQVIHASTIQEILNMVAPLTAMVSISVVIFVSLNNFMNVFLCEETLMKINLKAEEKLYKRLFFVYLCTIGILMMFLNEVVLLKLPMSVFVLALQVFYTVTLIAIDPYKQSLRVHTVTLTINQCVFIVFLVFINLINFNKDMDELLIIILGYFMTGLCGLLMTLTAVRLYYELRFGEALEKKIQKQREIQKEKEKRKQEEKLEWKKKQYQQEAKLKQNAKELERARNQFLYENQVKQDQAQSLVQWLEEKNWEAEEKEKFFYEKFAQKPLEWLKKHDKAEYLKALQAKEEHEKKQRKKKTQGTEGEYRKVVEKLKKECEKNLESWERQLAKHEKRIKKDMDYSQEMGRGMKQNFIKKEYQLKD